MSIPFLPSLRALAWMFASSVLILGAVDGGSVFLTRMAVPDDARQAGYAAAGSVADEKATPQTVRMAFEAAREDARGRDISISTKSFTLYPDGRVTLTARRTAPTLLLHRISALRHLSDVRATVTVTALPFS
jgi:hypothetical protein